jgi:hypothetical protein
MLCNACAGETRSTSKDPRSITSLTWSLQPREYLEVLRSLLRVPYVTPIQLSHELDRCIPVNKDIIKDIEVELPALRK